MVDTGQAQCGGGHRTLSQFRVGKSASDRVFQRCESGPFPNGLDIGRPGLPAANDSAIASALRQHSDRVASAAIHAENQIGVSKHLQFPKLSDREESVISGLTDV